MSKIVVTFINGVVSNGWIIDRDLDINTSRQVLVVDTNQTVDWWDFEKDESEFKEIVKLLDLPDDIDLWGWYVNLELEDLYREGYSESSFSIRVGEKTRKRGKIWKR